MFPTKPYNIMKKAIYTLATIVALSIATAAIAEEKSTPDSSFEITAIVEEQSTSNNGICRYKPSAFITGAITGVAGSASAAGLGLKWAEYYTLRNPITGKIMLGSKLPGASAAGIVGIMKNTAGAIRTVVAAGLMSPVVIKGGIVIAVGVGGYEAYCYFSDN